MMINRFIALCMVLILVVTGPAYSFPASNGTNWTNPYISGETLFDVTYDNGLFVAVGIEGVIKTSTDGISWSDRSSNAGSSTLCAVSYGNGKFVVASSDKKIMTSTNGTNWALQTNNTTFAL
jgi:hypothetical protein